MAVTPQDLADLPDKPYSATFHVMRIGIASRDAVIRTLSIGVGIRVRSQANIPLYQGGKEVNYAVFRINLWILYFCFLYVLYLLPRAETVRLELTSRFRSHLFSRQAPHPAGWLPL